MDLSSKGHNITIIERNPESLRRLGSTDGLNIVIGNGLDIDVIERAKVAEADAFFAVTRGDNTNIMAAQIVQRMNKAAKVCVKVADPERAQAYRNMGMFCINASSLLAGLCRDWLMNEPYETIDKYNVLSKELEI